MDVAGGGQAAAGPRRLASMDLEGVAAYIRSGACRSVAVLAGAGVSTGAGIPDFRSPGGMYDSLRPDLVTATPEQRAMLKADPTSVVTTDMFFQNQLPYMEVRRPFILGTQEQKWKATISHWFVKFLEEEGLLTRLFTQNIDGLDYQTGIARDRVCNVHGSISQVKCEACRQEMPLGDFCAEVRSRIKDIYKTDTSAPAESSTIPCPSCRRPTVKPTTVLFGAELPQEFFALSASDLPQVDLLIVAGTSLVVQPANDVVRQVPRDCPRLIVNKEQVGMDLGIEYHASARRDVWAGAYGCDEVFLELMRHLGWLNRLRAVSDSLPEENRKLLEAPPRLGRRVAGRGCCC